MSIKREYQICTRCVMDTSDPYIVFNKEGLCNHCISYFDKAKILESQIEERDLLSEAVDKIKVDSKNSPYDCIIGLSGGFDSTFALYTIVKAGLSPLIVHLDNGWNTTTAMQNIENAVKKSGCDLYTVVLDWREFRDLQLSFWKASVADLEAPTDHAIYATLLDVARKFKIRHVISGANHWTEGIHAEYYSYGADDWIYIRGIQRIFGNVELRTFPHFMLEKRLLISWLGLIKTHYVLNMFKFDKKECIEILKSEFGWQEYGGKHHESVYTRFLQVYYLPVKFNVYKLRSHLSNLICAGQISRDEAIKELDKAQNKIYSEMDKEFKYIAKKLKVSYDELMGYFRRPLKTYRDYPNSLARKKAIGTIVSAGKRLRDRIL